MKISGQILKRALKAAGIKQDQAAEKMNVSRQTINNYCKMSYLDDEIVENVKTFLNIDLRADASTTTTDEIDQLKAEIELLRDLLRRSDDQIKQRDEIIQLLKSKS